MSLRRDPTVDELLGDSLIQAVMKADKVEPPAVRRLLADAAGRVAAVRRERGPKAARMACRGPALDWRAPPLGRAAFLPDLCGSGLC